MGVGWIVSMLVVGWIAIGLAWGVFDDTEPEPCRTQQCWERQRHDDLRWEHQDRLGGSR